MQLIRKLVRTSLIHGLILQITLLECYKNISGKGREFTNIVLVIGKDKIVARYMDLVLLTIVTSA